MGVNQVQDMTEYFYHLGKYKKLRIQKLLKSLLNGKMMRNPANYLIVQMLIIAMIQLLYILKKNKNGIFIFLIRQLV